MRPENKKMQEFLKSYGIKAKAKYIWNGSLKGCWRLYNHSIKWYDNISLQKTLKALNFKDFDNKELNNFSGNGGIFSIFARNSEFDNFYRDKLGIL